MHWYFPVFTAPPPTGPEFPFEGDNQLLATVDQNTMDVSLNCVAKDNTRGEDRFKWYRNGQELDWPMKRQVERDRRGSGFYCCRFFNGSSQPEESVFNTYCVTLVFRGELNHLLLLTLSFSLSLSLSLSLIHTLTHSQTCTHSLIYTHSLSYGISKVCCP